MKKNKTGIFMSDILKSVLSDGCWRSLFTTANKLQHVCLVKS